MNESSPGKVGVFLAPKIGRKRIVSWVRFLLVGGALGFLASALAILFDGRTDERVPSDLGIVYGNKVEPDGTPSLGLQARLDTALQAYRAGLVPKLFVSGGVGKEGVDESVAMQNYLIGAGVKRTDIITDGLGNTSIRTSRHAAAYLKQHGLKSALVITEHFHVARCKMLCRRCGIEQVSGLGADDLEVGDIYATFRETIAYWVYFLRLK